MSNSGFDKVRDMRGDNSIDVGDGGSRITTGSGDDTITAGDGYDKVRAGRGDNQISVGDGGSKISTKGGDDTITAGDGYDRISAGNGDNQIDVGDGGSFISAGKGDDVIVSGDGYDFIFAGDGDNDIDVGDGGSFIKAGSGDDTINAGDGYDKIFAGNGDNVITAGDGGSFIHTGSGDDIIQTGDGWDMVFAGNGDNQVDIGDGGGMVLTGSGDDSVTVGDGSFAFVHTGSGDDRVTMQIDDHLCFAKLLGGNGVDTLVLDINLETYKDDQFQAEMAYFLEHRAPDGRPFYFRSVNIWVHSFEQVEVIVDGVSLDPIDLDVVASDDTASLREDDGAVLFGSVLDNDDIPNGLGQVTLIQAPAAGVLDLSPDGTYSFDPNGDFEGLAEGEITEVTFVYEVSDLDGDTSQATATISIIGDNDVPFLAAGTLEANEDGTTVDVDLSTLGSDVDSDDDGSTLTYSVTGAPSEGSASITGTTLTFDPGSDFQDLALGETRDVTIQVTAEDAHGATAVNTVTVTVTGGNDAPTLAAGFGNADEDGASVDVDLAALGADVDSDDDGSTLTYSVTGAPSEGSASITGTTLTFDPGSDFQDLALGETRDVTIQVTAEDAHGATAVNTVTVTVTGGNDAPTVAAGFGNADEDGASVDVDLAALGADVDSDDDGSTLTYSVTGAPSEGSALITGTTLTFDPGSDFQDLALGETRDVTIQVTAEDAHGATAVNTVTVTVTGGNDAPTLAAAVAAADEDGTTVDVDLAVLGADVDSDDDGSTLTYTVTGSPSEGNASISGTTLTFDPGADFQDLALGETRDVTIQVTAEDAHGATAVNTVTVTVTGTNDAPVAQAISGNVAEEGTSAEAFSVGIADSSTVPNAGLFYVLDYENQSLTEVFRAVGTIDTPLQAAQSLNVTNGMVLSLNGNNADWGAVAASIVDGVETLADPNLFDLSGYSGSTVADPRGFVLYRDSVSNATLTISVPDVETPDGPTTYEISAEVISFQDNRVGNIDIGAVQFTSVPQPAPDSVTISADFSDVDSTDTHSFSVDTTGTQGEVINNGDGTFTYSSNGAFDGLAAGETTTDTFTYTVTDDSGAANDSDTETATITITGINDVPTLAEGSLAANEDGGAVSFDLSSIGDDVDSDDDGSTLTYTITGQPGEGSASISGATLTFDPGSEFQDLALGETRDVVIQITAEDAHGATAVNDVTVTVTGVNDAPTLAAALASADEDGATVDVDLAALGADVDSDDDGSTLTYTVTGSPSEGSASISGTTLTFDPGADFQDLALGETRDVSIQVTAEDAHGATAVNTVTVTVTGGNDAPVFELASSDLSADLNVGFAKSDSFDAAALAEIYSGSAAASVKTINGTDVFQVGPGNVTRLPHTNIDLVDAGVLDTGDTVVINISGEILRTGGDQDAVFGVEDGNGNLSFFTIDQTTGALWSDVFESNGSAGIGFPDTATSDRVNITGSGNPQVSAFELRIVLDGAQDTITLVSGDGTPIGISTQPLDQIDPANGLRLFVANDQSGETFNYVSLDYDLEVTRLKDSGSLNFNDVDVSDTHTASIEDVRLTGNANGLDVAGATALLNLTVNSTTALAEGSVDWSFAADDADYAYLALGESLLIEYDVQIDDGNGGTAMETVSVRINGVNDAPVAVNDAAGTGENTAITVDVLANDTDADLSDTHTVDAASVTSGGGSVTVVGNQVEWTPGSDYDYLAQGETATVEIAYDISDNNGGTATGNLTITVTGDNDGPTLAAGLGNATEDGATVDVDLAALGADVDSDDDGSTLTYTVTGSPSEGSASISGTTLTFDPGVDFQDLALGETRDVTIQVTAEDAHGATAVNTVTVTVTGGNDAPTLAAALASADEDGASVDVDLAVLGADVDSDDDGSTLSYSVTGNPGEGSASISGTTLTFDPGADFQDLAVGETRDVTIQVTAEDTHGATAVNTVTVTVTGTNDAPVAAAVSASVDENGAGATGFDATDGANVIPNLGRWWIADYDQGTLISVGRTSSTLQFEDVAPTNGVVFTLNPNAPSGINWGAAAMSYSDGVGSVVDPALIQVEGFAGTPVVSGDFLAVDGTISNGTVRLSVADVQTPDGPATFDFTVTGVDNPAPGAASDTLHVDSVLLSVTPQVVSGTVDISASFTDVDTSDTHSIAVDSSATTGAVTNNGDGTFTYDTDGAYEGLAQGETATDSFTYTVDDGKGGTSTETVTVTINGQNDAPTLGAGLATANEDGSSVDLDLSSLGDDVDSDDDGASLSYSVSGQPNEGSASISGTVLTFAPGGDFQDLAQGETRDVVVQITAQDAHGASVVNEVTVTVTGVNDAPVTDAEDVTTDEDTAINIDVLAGDTDAEGQTLSVQSVSNGANGTVAIEPNGTVTYTPNANFNGTDSFTYTASDGNGGTTEQAVSVTVSAVNDAPEATAIDAGTVDEDSGAQTIDLLATATDIEGDVLSVSGISVVDDMGVALSFTDNGDGTIAIDPIQYGEDLGQGESRVVTISYDVSDGTTSVSNTATVTVNGVTNNIAPTALDTAVAPEGAGFVFDENPVVTSQKVSETDFYQNGSYQYDANNDYNPTVIAFGDGGYAVAWREQDGEYSGSTLTSRTDQVAVQLYGADDAPIGSKMLFGEIDQSYSNDDIDRSYDTNPRMVSMADGGFAMTWEGNYRTYSGTTQTRYERDVFVQVFDADGAPTSTDPIKVSQTIPAANGSSSAYDAFQDFQPEIAALGDGGIAVAWRGQHYSLNGSTLDSRDYDNNIYVRAFDADGTARGAEVSLGSVDKSYGSDDIDRHYDYAPRIASAEDGSFAVVWHGSYSDYTGTTYTGASYDVFMQRFDADGVAQGAPIQVSETVDYQSGTRAIDGYRDSNAEVAALANGGYVVTWHGRHEEYNGSTFVSTEENIWARVYDADGQAVTAVLSLGEVDQSYGPDDRDRAYDYNAKVIATADGGFVVTWYANYYAYNGTTATEYTQDIYVQRFDENGDALAAAQQISQTGDRTTGNYQVYDSIADSDPQITDLLGGGFVVSWYSNQQTYNGSTFVESQVVVQAQRFDVDGNAVDDVITLGNVAQDQNGYDRSQDSQARVTALNDGGFAIAWYNYTTLYSATGAYLGNSTDIHVAAVHANGGGTSLADPVDVDVAGLIGDADIPDGDQLTVTVATGSKGSTATVSGTVISILPNAAYYAALGRDETEEETFTYTVTDLAGAQATATVTLTVTGNNDKPVANAIAGAVDEDGPTTTLTADFTDVDTNDSHSYSVNSADTLGVVTNNGDGTFDYDPNGAFEALAAGETATDSFRYTVRDAAGTSSTATATVTITGENDAPTAAAAAISNGYVYAETPETNQQQVSITDPYTSGSRTYDGNSDSQQQVVAFGDGGYAVAWRQLDGTYSGSSLVSRADQIAVQIYDADHNPVGGIQTFGEVDQSYSNDNIDRSYDQRPMLAEMPDGGFAMTWYGDYRSYTGTTSTRYERDVFVQVFDGNGDPTSTDPIKVSQTVYATSGSTSQFDVFQDYNPMIGGLSDGGIAITWQSQDYDTSGTSVVTNSRNSQIKVQTFDADGTSRGSAVELGSDDRSYSSDNIDRHSDSEPRIATSDDGGFAVVWRGNYSDYNGTTYTGNSNDVFIQVFNADGTVQGATQQVSQTVDYTSGSSTQDAHRDYNPEVTALSDGGYAVAWYGEHSTYSGSTRTSSEYNVYVRVYDSNGQAVDQAVSLGSVDTSYANDNYDRHYDQVPNITATEDGGFVVVWTGDHYSYSGTTQTSNEADIWIQRFDADGAQVGASEKLSQTVYRQNGSSDYDDFRDYNPVVTNLEGGGYVVVWQSNQRTYNGSTFVSSEQIIQAQMFDAQGDKIGDIIDFGTVAQDTNGNDRSSDSGPEVAALSGGGFAITWYNNTQSYSSTGSYLGNSVDVMVGAVQPIGNGSLTDGVVVDVADKIDDIDLAGGDSLTVSVDAVGSNGSTASVIGTEITISPNLAAYAQLAVGDTAVETFTYTVTDASGAQASATLTFTARGENDAPVVDSVTYSAPGAGTIAFSDVDNGDTHTVSAIDATITGDANALNGADVFDFISFDTVDQTNDNVDWTVSLTAAAQADVAAALADGETLTIDYTFAITDEEEDQAQTTVSITLDGDGFLI